MKATVVVEKDGELHIVLLSNVKDKADAEEQAKALVKTDNTIKTPTHVAIQKEIKTG